MRVDGKFKQVDPSQWDEDMDVPSASGSARDARTSASPIASRSPSSRSCACRTACDRRRAAYLQQPEGHDRRHGARQRQRLCRRPLAAAAAGPERAQARSGGDEGAGRDAGCSQADLQRRSRKSAARLQLQQQKDAATAALDRSRAEAEAALARARAQFEAELARDKAAADYALAREKLAHERILSAAQAEQDELPENRPGGDLSE
jgi:hypothetical protein